MDADALLGAGTMREMQAVLARCVAFEQRVQAALATACGCEDPLAQALALSLMPLDTLRAEADAAVALNAALGDAVDSQPAAASGATAQPLAVDDLLAQSLLRWFKDAFFSWVNAPACSFCVCASTVHAGMGTPTAEEAAHGCSRVELYRCGLCDTVTRFPRCAVTNLLCTCVAHVQTPG